MKERNARSAGKRPISTVNGLVEALRHGGGPGEYLRVLDRVDIPMGELEPYCTWNRKRYTRNCIARTDGFELLLICYEPGQRTSIHDHATEEAWVRPVAGAVIEERYEPVPGGGLRKLGATELAPGTFSYLHNGRGIHRYVNPGHGRSVTLNLYARPLRTWKVYDERSGDSYTAPAGT